MAAKHIQGYKVVPIKFCETSTTTFQIFLKKLAARDQSADKPVDRTLLVLNLPSYVTRESITSVFSCVGAVKNVLFQSKSGSFQTYVDSEKVPGFKTACVIYEKNASVQKALELKELDPLSTDKHQIIVGMEKWMTDYNNSSCNVEEMQEENRKFSDNYLKEQKILKQQEKQKDDGGWTVVSKKGRNPGLSRKESVENKIKEKIGKAEKRKFLDDFYVFQKRESKMKRVAEMRKEFEEAKKKVQALKEARKFKPY